jgi:RNA polymerase sigma factor for flagellar operon FliA
LIAQYAPLVKYVAGRMRLALPASLDFDDILGYGTIGLIEAVDRFDPTRGIKFETYAIPRIRGSIIDAIRSLDIVPRGMRDRAKVVERAFQELFKQRGAMPSDEMVAAHLDMTVEQVRKAVQDASCTMLPLSGGNRDEASSFEETLADESAVEPAEAAAQVDSVQRLAWALDQLPQRDRMIITLYYYEELTMKEVSEVLGVTESRISQLLTRARFQLKALLHDQGMPSFDLAV